MYRMATVNTFLRMEDISKGFPGVKALQGVTLEVRQGEVHALMGENGAGKSTLMKILTGAYRPDTGRILVRGEQVDIRSPQDAQALGISMIHQELSLIPHLTVGQNIFLGREPRRGAGLVNWNELYRQAQQLLDRLNLGISAKTEVVELSIAQQQMVEVAKALSLNPQSAENFRPGLIAMDEPTSALTDRETEVLFDVMRSLKAQGVSIIYISHRLNEIFEICDHMTVLRDGQYVGERAIAGMTEDDIVHMMVGRELGDLYPPAGTKRGDIVLETVGLKDNLELKGVSMNVRAGEILGIAGLVGAGRTALAETLFGIRPTTAGEIRIGQQPVKLHGPGDAIKYGLGFVPEDRKQQGLFLNMGVRDNLVMSSMEQVSKLGFLNFGAIDKVSSDYVKKMNIRTPTLRQRIRNLSGGNQQKVIIARWLTLHPKVLILDEPTRGIDVGAKAEIHGLMRELAEQGVGVLMISSELPEVLGVSDRVIVMHEGSITGEFSRAEANEDVIMRAASGVAGETEQSA